MLTGCRPSISSTQQPRVFVQQEHVGPRRSGLRLRHDVRTNVEPHPRTSIGPEDSERPSGIHPRIISGTMAAPIAHRPFDGTTRKVLLSESLIRPLNFRPILV